MHRLQNSILQQSSLLIDVVHYAAELDWLVSYCSTTSPVSHLTYCRCTTRTDQSSRLTV